MSNEPVAWMNPDYTDPRRRLETDFHFVSPETGPPDEDWVPLYTQDDTALLRQCLDSLEKMLDDAKHERVTVTHWNGCVDAITALRERLKESTHERPHQRRTHSPGNHAHHGRAHHRE
jgi:hypothetical protein